jgi:nucleotide-binding universal stress UspA family protein
MSHIKKIMVAIGFSPYAQAILQYAAHMATDLDAQLVVVNVINARDVEAISRIESMGYELSASKYVEELKEERKNQFDELMTDISFPKERLQVLFEVGNPFDELLAMVKKKGVDLVIMGAKGRSDLQHVLLGSVADKMAHHSTVPVLIHR